MPTIGEPLGDGVGFAYASPNTDMTPYRSTRLHLDLPSQMRQAGGYAGVRMGSDVAEIVSKTGGKDSANSTGLRYWPGAKCWTLQPLQERLTRFQEAFPPGILPADMYLYTVNPSLASLANLADQQAYYTPYGEGMLYRGDVITSGGDPFYKKNVPADGSWAGKLTSSPAPPQGNYDDSPEASGKPPRVAQLARPITPIDTIFETVTQRPDRGFFLRWVLTGTQLHNPDYVLNCYFGQYCVVITGDGQAHLTEYCRATPETAYRWVLRSTFRYCRQSQVSGVSHSLGIFPVMSLSGPCIEFWGANVEGAGIGAGVAAPQSYAYFATDLVRAGDVDESPGHVTRAGVCRIDVRRDIRVGFQVSPLLYVTEGFLWEGVWGARGLAQNPPYTIRQIVQQPWPGDYGSVVSDAHVSSVLVDPQTGDPLEAGYSGPVGVKFEFSGHVVGGKEFSAETPILYGYHMVQEPTLHSVPAPEPGPVSLPVRSVDFTCQGPLPGGDNGEVLLFDQTNAAERLRNRGHLNVKLTTTAKKQDGTNQLVTLFRGQALRPRYTRFGKPGSTFPHPMSGSYSVLLSGLADQMKEVTARTITYQKFAGSEDIAELHNLADGPIEGWRITSIVRYLLGLAFPASMIDIEDNEIRLFSNMQALTNSDYMYDPHVDILSRCQALVRNYLGGYLVFDVGAGVLAGAGRPDTGSPEGAWRIVYTASEGAEPLMIFIPGGREDLVDEEGGGADPLPYLPMAASTYANTVLPVVVATGHLESYCIPPEVNHVWAFTTPFMNDERHGYRYEQHAYNVLSYQVPGCTTAPDPNSPHYIGHEVMRVVPDPSLYCAENPSRSQNAVDFIARRIIEFAGRGARVLPLYGPLHFVTDPDTSRLRLPRFGDPVQWSDEGDWYIRSVSPAYSLDKAQMCHYELISFAPLYGGSGEMLP